MTLLTRMTFKIKSRNSLHDLELSQFEPFFCWVPNPLKTFSQRYLSWLYFPIIYTFIFLDQLVKRIIFSFVTKTNLFEKSDMIPLTVPLAMLLFGNTNPFAVFAVWIQIILVSSFAFGLIGLNAGHHHPVNNGFNPIKTRNIFYLFLFYLRSFYFYSGSFTRR